ncbi:MAG: EF-hand domain-containing protein [Pseudomonadota bacterium]
MTVLRPLTGADIADANEQFGSCDLDGDGRIQCSEFAELLEKLGSTLSPAALQSRFDGIDADHDGRIDVDEFMEWWRGN